MKRDRHILQKYLDNELSERELTRFEQELNASPDLMVDLDLYKEVDEAICRHRSVGFPGPVDRPAGRNTKIRIRQKGFSFYTAMALCSIGSIGIAGCNWSGHGTWTTTCPIMISSPST